MKRILIVIAVVVVLGVGGLIIWHPSSSSDASSKTKPAASSKSAQKTIAKSSTPTAEYKAIQDDLAAGAKLYDVRTAAEYASGHFAGAVNFPVENLQNNQLPDVAKDTKIYVYCRSGVRAGQAKQILETAGFTAVQNLGGLADVERLGGKLE